MATQIEVKPLATARWNGMVDLFTRPGGWIPVGPRQDSPRLARSPNMKPVEEKPVWSTAERSHPDSLWFGAKRISGRARFRQAGDP